jgi:hypothetical protein
MLDLALGSHAKSLLGGLVCLHFIHNYRPFALLMHRFKPRLSQSTNPKQPPTVRRPQQPPQLLTKIARFPGINFRKRENSRYKGG